MKSFLSLLFAFLCAGKILAADFASNFSAANELYAKGDFAAAAAGYDKILQSGRVSPALLFNYGNAEFKSGNLGKAIAAFRQAELLAPRDSEIRANLGFVRNQVQGPLLQESRWRAALGQLTLNQWTFLAAIALWLTFLSLAAAQFRPALAPKLRSATVFLAVLAILFGAATGFQAVGHFSQQTAVVISDNATARSGPFDDAQNVFAVHDGAELPVLDQYGVWVQVADGPGRTGWLSIRQVELLSGA